MSFGEAQYIIDTAIGATNATGGSTSAGSVMAKLNNIISSASSASSNASNAASYASSASSNASSASSNASNAYSQLTNGTYGLSALNTKLTSLTSSVTGGSTPVVKSVQRGTNNGLPSGNITITISSINANKAFVILLQPTIRYGGSAEKTQNTPTISALSSTSLTVTASNYYINSSWNSQQFSWQVIEFY